MCPKSELGLRYRSLDFTSVYFTSKGVYEMMGGWAGLAAVTEVSDGKKRKSIEHLECIPLLSLLGSW